MQKFMAEAIHLAEHGMRNNEGGPFGAIIVRENEIISRGNNQVLMSNDPTAHAEVVAIRQACKTLNTFILQGCTIYTSCEPCPMCLAAIYWSRIDKIYFGATKVDAKNIGFDDAFIYQELDIPYTQRSIPMEQLMHQEALIPFSEWQTKSDKTPY